MNEPAARRKWTEAEYLAAEAVAEEKHILWDGERYPVHVAPEGMAGASRKHNRIVVRVLAELDGRLRGKPCEPYASDQRIRLTPDRYVYPDASVVCPPVQTHPDDPESITNPRVVFEVLSDSTEALDRGDKLHGYASIASLTDYLLVSQKTPLVDHFARAESGWTLKTVGPGGVVVLASLGIELPIDELYAGIFDP